MKRPPYKLKHDYSTIAVVGLVSLAVLVVYRNDFVILVSEALQNEALNHILFIPVFSAILIYIKRDMIKASLRLKRNQKTSTKYFDELIGISLCLVAFLLYWYGSYTFYPLEYHVASLPIFLVGVTLFLTNFKTMWVLLLPTLFLLFLTPPPTEYLYAIGGTMANFNTQASFNLLKAIGMPVTLVTNFGSPTITLLNPSGASTIFTVDLPCSGIYSLMAFAVFAVFLALLAKASIPKKFGLIIIGFLIFDTLNIVRITTIISAANFFGQEIAMTLFHTAAGLILVFIGMILTLLIGEKLFRIQILSPRNEQKSVCPECERSREENRNFCLNCGNYLKPSKIRFSKTFYAKIFLLILGCSLVVLSINAPTFVTATTPTDTSAQINWQNATSIFPQIYDSNNKAQYEIRFLYRDESYEKIAKQDVSLMYGYFPTNKTKPVVYVSVGVASSISNLHNWEVCYVSWQTAQDQYPLVSVLDTRDVQLLEDVPLVARYFVFESPQNYTQITLYWYEKANFRTEMTVEQKYVRLSLIILAENPTTYQQMEAEAFVLGQRIAEHWEPLKSQSLVSLGVLAQQLLLALSVGFVVFTKITQSSADWMKKNNNMKIFVNIATKEEKMILETLKELTRNNGMIETSDVHRRMNEKTQDKTSLEDLLDSLDRLAQYGLIRREIVSANGFPKQIWKT